jgi:hypothetical protein
MIHAGEQERDGIDQRSVEIEQHCEWAGLSHERNLNPLHSAL